MFCVPRRFRANPKVSRSVPRAASKRRSGMEPRNFQAPLPVHVFRWRGISQSAYTYRIERDLASLLAAFLVAEGRAHARRDRYEQGSLSNVSRLWSFGTTRLEVKQYKRFRSKRAFRYGYILNAHDHLVRRSLRNVERLLGNKFRFLRRCPLSWCVAVDSDETTEIWRLQPICKGATENSRLDFIDLRLGIALKTAWRYRRYMLAKMPTFERNAATNCCAPDASGEKGAQ